MVCLCAVLIFSDPHWMCFKKKSLAIQKVYIFDELSMMVSYMKQISAEKLMDKLQSYSHDNWIPQDASLEKWMIKRRQDARF